LKKYCFLIYFSWISVCCYSQQHLYTSFFAGLANYKGDLGSASFYLNNANEVGGIGAVVELNHRMLIRGEINYGQVSGTDKTNIKTRSRNLSFSSKVTEFALMFEYILFDLYEYKVSPYFFAGVATFKFSPYTKDRNGNIVFLAEQCTEGQGFYKDRKDYKLNQIAIPFGAGIQWALSSNMRLAFEVGLRKTSTDYLDDVSTTYINPALLAQKKGYTAVSLAYRAAELPNASPYPADGTSRGNPGNKDSYIFTGLSFRISLQPKGRERIYQYKPKTARTSCPTVF
jgi:opacity protein-like surface antigen